MPAHAARPATTPWSLRSQTVLRDSPASEAGSPESRRRTPDRPHYATRPAHAMTGRDGAAPRWGWSDCPQTRSAFIRHRPAGRPAMASTTFFERDSRLWPGPPYVLGERRRDQRSQPGSASWASNAKPSAARQAAHLVDSSSCLCDVVAVACSWRARSPAEFGSPGGQPVNQPHGGSAGAELTAKSSSWRAPGRRGTRAAARD